MKKLILLMSFLFSLNTYASLITIELSEDEVVVGESITVNLIASEFSPFDTFDFDFVYDNSLFSFETGSLTSDLNSVFPFIFEENENINGLAISFVDFFSYTNSDFLLASFQITAKSAGESDFYLGSVNFYNYNDLFNDPTLSVDSSSRASVIVQTSVPEPQTWLLLLTALFMVNRIKHRRLSRK